MKYKLFKKRILIILIIIINSICLIGCTNTIKEEKHNEIVNFLSNNYSDVYNYLPGLPIKFTLDGAKFICKSELGSLDTKSYVKERTIDSEEIIYYKPTSKMLIKGIYSIYIDVTIIKDDNIIGYIVIKINFDGNFGCSPELVTSKLFVNKDKQITNVTKEYVDKKIARYLKK